MQAALATATQFAGFTIQGLTLWATRCPGCPACPALSCSCPATSCSLTCGGPASTGEIRSETTGTAEPSILLLAFIFSVGSASGALASFVYRARATGPEPDYAPAAQESAPQVSQPVSPVEKTAAAKATSSIGATPLRLKNA